MEKAVRIEKTGGPEVLQVRSIDLGALPEGQVLVEQAAVGVNFLDVMQRNGSVPFQLPNGLGLEGAGTVAALGAGVMGLEVGDRVAYALGQPGSYATARMYPAERLVKIPDSMSFENAAAVVFKGITAQYLLKSTYPVGQGTVVLLYGAAGALGQLMVPWAKYLGAFVIGVVSKEASTERAKQAGCDEVLVWGDDLAARVMSVTGGMKAHVVYDGVGRKTFDASIDCVRSRGLMASIGASSGAPRPVELATLNSKGSIFLTRPSIVAHATNIDEYRQRVEDVFAAVGAGIIRSNFWKAYPFEEVATAHAELEAGKSAGAIVLTT